MFKYIITFVLVILMVKTNAQMPYYYYGGSPFQLYESDDKLLIQLEDPADSVGVDSLYQKILSDPDFDRSSDAKTGYIMLQKKTGSSISKSAAISNYINENNVVYVSFMFDDGTGGISSWGVGNDIVVKDNNGLTSTQIQTIASNYGTLIAIRELPGNMGLYQLFFSKTDNTLQVANNLYLSGNFEWAEPNFFYSVPACGSTTSTYDCPQALYTTDPKMIDRSQWGIYNDATNNTYVTQYGGVPFADINICTAWEKSQGNNIVVAVVDDGVDISHPELSNAVTGYDITNWAPKIGVNGTPDAYSHHGTECAGIILAPRAFSPTTGSGMTGVAPQAKIMPVRSGFYDYSSIPVVLFQSNGVTLGLGIQAAAQHGADVINCSWSMGAPPTPTSSTVKNMIEYATTNGRGGKGCVVVFSAGNENKPNINWPSSYPKVIAVGAMNMCDTRKRSSNDPLLVGDGVTPDAIGVSCDNVNKWGSNYGEGSGYSSADYNTSGYLTVTAPGVHIYTTDLFSSYNPDFGGTSASAPFVSGVAALMLEVNPCLEWEEVKDLISITATKTNTSTYYYGGGKSLSEWNNEMGYGRLNASDAVTLAHDIYKQNKTESTDKIFTASHKIFAGNHVTTLIPFGDYHINSYTSVEFRAPESIDLFPGFDTYQDAVFDAYIAGGCDNAHEHYKQGSADEKRTEKYYLNSSFIPKTKIYPNPAQNDLNVSFYLVNNDKVSFTITDMMGRKILNSVTENYSKGANIESLSIRKLPPGVYIVTIKTSAEINQFKFIKR